MYETPGVPSIVGIFLFPCFLYNSGNHGSIKLKVQNFISLGKGIEKTPKKFKA